MQFKQGTHVYTSDGTNVGSLDRVVLDPQTDDVIELVIRKGRLFGEDKVIPMEWVASATEERVTLDKAERDLPALRKFEDTYYVPVDAKDLHGDLADPSGYESPFVYDYPPLGVAWWGFSNDIGAPPVVSAPQFQKRSEENIPQGTVALREGARVLSKDGDHIGNVAELFTDESNKHVTHLLISQGLLFKERKLIPTNWIKLAGEDDVMLTVSTSVVHDLPAYAG